MGELLDTCSYQELLQWGEYYGIEPFGEWRADVRSAHIVATLANINRDTKKRSKPYEINDFLLFERPHKEEKKEDVGAKIDPTLLAWLFGKARKDGGGKLLPQM